MESFWDLVGKPKEEPQKEVKEETPEVVEAAPVEEKVEKPKTAKAAKKETKKVEEEKFEYPFSLYLATGDVYIDITSFGFEDGKGYTGEEISKIMLQHRKYGFAGEMTYSMMKEDNTLVASAKQFKKG